LQTKTAAMIATVRLAIEEDVPLLPAIERSAGQVFRAIPSLAWIADDTVQTTEEHLQFVRFGTSWVAVDICDRPLGFLNGQVLGREFHICQAAVDRAHQGRGYGRALIKAAIDWAKAQELAAITLTTFRDVPWNEPFYTSLGFETLEQVQLCTRLLETLRKEVEHGLPEEQRCAMRLRLT